MGDAKPVELGTSEQWGRESVTGSGCADVHAKWGDLMGLKHGLRKLFWKTGYDISRFTPDKSSEARRKKLLESYAVNVVLDVGANTGGFAKELRNDLGYSGRIVSFEPLSAAFQKLKENASGDGKWQVVNCALGETNARMEINVAGNSESSSLLEMLPAHLSSAPESRYVAKETIEVKRLDSIADDLWSMEDHVYLKIDTQGYERQVIEGAGQALARIATVQLEMSLVPLYEGAPLFDEMHRLLTGMGFRLVTIEPVFADQRSGELLQVDGIYHRS